VFLLVVTRAKPSRVVSRNVTALVASAIIYLDDEQSMTTEASSLRGGVGSCYALGEGGVLKHALELAAGAGRLRLRKAATNATNSAGRSSMGLWPHA
jgi:hypothetical protein